MAVEAPKKVSLLPEVAKRATIFGVLGVGLLFALNILAVVPAAIATAFSYGAIIGGAIGVMNWVANL